MGTNRFAGGQNDLDSLSNLFVICRPIMLVAPARIPEAMMQCDSSASRGPPSDSVGFRDDEDSISKKLSSKIEAYLDLSYVTSDTKGETR